jgi:hypothetical protein
VNEEGGDGEGMDSDTAISACHTHCLRYVSLPMTDVSVYMREGGGGGREKFDENR